MDCGHTNDNVRAQNMKFFVPERHLVEDLILGKNDPHSRGWAWMLYGLDLTQRTE